MKRTLIFLGIFCGHFSIASAQSEKLSEFFGGCCPLYGQKTSLFSSLDQTLFFGEAIRLEHTILQSSSIDISQVDSKGAIVFQTRGIYSIAWAVESKSPKAQFLSFGVMLDDQILPETIASEWVGPDVLHRMNGTHLLFISPGQVFKLVSLSEKEINLVAYEIRSSKSSSAVFSADLVVEL